MIRLVILCLPILLTVSDLYGQQKFWKRSRAEYVFGLGATNFLGELGGADQIGTNGMRDLEFPATRPLFNIGYLYKLSNNGAVQLDFSYGKLSGNDNLTQEPSRSFRNLHFRSPIVELSGKYQLSVTTEKKGHVYKLKGVKGWKNIQITTYAFAGLGLIWFNPRAQGPTGVWYSLQPLCTEGQGIYPTRKKYSRLQPVIPLGLGIKWMVDRNWLVGLEYGLRKTFTDYLDDVSTTYPNRQYLMAKMGPESVYFSDPSSSNSDTDPYQPTSYNQQRGDPSDKDAYMFAVISLRYRVRYTQRFLGMPRF
ncbi:MAG: hypothetical protein KKA07_06140 [Bacteroidetes bacterium]|nr:hypothetical protein [Bacteroidota bacterium]MBU1718634.1 hypothetical protein [Bacteroidota bacterium]